MACGIPDRPLPSPTASRRGFLNVLLGAGLTAWLGTVLYPVLRYLSPLEESGSADEVVLADKARQDIETSGFAIVPLGVERVLVFRDARGGLRALSAKCTHEGCTVQYKADQGLVWCACHNGRFDVEGRVISGPPPRPLLAYKTSGSLDTKVVVSRDMA